MRTSLRKRFLKMALTGILTVLWVVAFGFGVDPAGALDPSTDQKIVGYFVEWGVYGRDYHVTDIPADKLTHINYAFAELENGEVEVWDSYAALEKFYPATDSWADPPGALRGNFNQLRLMKEKYPHIKVLISVGGWTGSGGFSDMAATEEGRTKFAQSALRFIQKYNFDGVDIDWEYPVCTGLQPGRAEDGENFTLLLEALRNTLGNSYLLTIAVSANPDCLDLIEIEAFEPYVDWINIMTYDYHGAWEAHYGTTGHNSPLHNNNDPLSPYLNIDAAVNYLVNRGVPLQKIIPGLAFYGRSAAGVEGGGDGLYASFTGPGPGSFEEGMLDYKDIKENYLDKNGYVYLWDDIAAVPYLFNMDKREFISFDDPSSIENKASYVAGNGLGGVMFWELSGDNGDLLNAIWNGLGVPVVPKPTYACSDGVDNDNDGYVDYPDDPGCTCAEDTDESDPVPPPPGDGLKVEVSISSDWKTGYCANVTVTNNNSFQVDWVSQFETEGTVSSLWCATYTQAGNTITARGVSWNKSLKPGASTTFGFCAERSEMVPPQCSDGKDNDNDGLIDYPHDPGCTSLEDDDETNQAPPVGAIETAISVTSDWGSGYCANVAITNRGNTPIDWSTQFEVDGTISSLWNAAYTQNGNLVAVEGLDWNNMIGANQTTTIGFCATR